MKKILTVVGARPQFVKAGTVSREIFRRSQAGCNIQEVIVHTGQHYDANMSDVFFEEMQIPKPHHSLDVGGASHGAMTGSMLGKLEEVMIQEQPDWVLVYGDTNSTLAGALSASKLHIKIAHIEAGLRSFNMRMPEEVNRILTDRVSRLLFCPTQLAVDNLNKEGVENWNCGAEVINAGDVMLDGALFYRGFSEEPKGLKVDTGFVLCTVHRAENTDDPTRIADIVNSLNAIGREHQVVIPLHPRTKKILQDSHLDTSNLTIIEPVGYLNMIWLLENCGLVMTDSGGLQKEAFFFSKPCITLRDETEWMELVEVGANTLVGAYPDQILNAYHNSSVLDFQDEHKNLYGGGKASERIVAKLIDE